MGTKKNTNTVASKKLSAVVETARGTGHPFSLIDRHRPLSKPEFQVFDAIREAVPIVDAALGKIIRLIGGFKVECEDKSAERELELFLKNVPTSACSRGINGFISSYLDSLLVYGIAVAEMVGFGGKGVNALYNAPLDNLIIKDTDDPFKYSIAVKNENGKEMPIKNPERIIITSANATASHPEGKSILEGLPFVTSVLLKIFDSIGTNFERIGNLRYAVTYKPDNMTDSAYGSDRAEEIAREWSSAMSDKNGVRDFVAVGDVDIKVIGADNQMISTEIPVRQMLEQIVAKLGIPPFLLGLHWSTAERMSKQQSDMLTSELEYYRSLLNTAIEKICRTKLLSLGYSCDFEIVWDDITLQDEVELAKARLYRAQATVLEKEVK